MCKDRAVAYLNAQHYNPILLPREDFDVLQVLAGSPDDLMTVGAVTDLVQGGAPTPDIHRDELASDISNRRSSKLDAKTAVDVLGRLLRALGAGAIGMKAEANAGESFEIVTQGVQRDSVAYLPLAHWLASTTLRPDTLQLMKPFANIYLVTETLKSASFGVVGYADAGGSAQLNADALQGVISASGSLSVTHGSGQMLCYKGDRPLRFAFRALPLTLSAKGASLGVSADEIVARFKGDDTAVEGAETASVDRQVFPVLAPGELLDVKAA